MVKPTLLVMAAGIGSRFGGLKQLAPVGKAGEPIIDFSVYDAIEAGFEKVVFIITKEIEEEFRLLIGNKVGKHISVEYAFQETNKLPEGWSVPEGRAKPWGTGHALICAKEHINGSFAVINADDYYGKDAFRVIYEFLLNNRDKQHSYSFCMVGYKIENTLTDHGHVARGVCKIKNNNNLESVTERLRIEKHGDVIEFTADNGQTWEIIEKGTTVSMNLWGFTNGIFSELEGRFPDFLDKAMKKDPNKAEYLLPSVVNDLLEEGKATVRVLHSSDKWYGVTYRQDLEPVASAIQELQNKGHYPPVLF